MQNSENLNFECKNCSKEPYTHINIGRFISKLDLCFAKNDLEGAVATVEYWEKEAASLGDKSALLTILNEELGLFRRINNREKATRAIELTCEILDSEEIDESLSRATVLINLATTLSAFGDCERALAYYGKAESVYKHFQKESTYEFATLLNNKSASLCTLKRFDEAEACLRSAIEILSSDGRYDADIALSYLSLAHLYFDRDDNAIDAVESFVDTAWEYVNSSRQKRDSDYAFAISKCVPSFRYFGREIEAAALEEVAEEIYGGKV
ncbi:MAG: tetratricopeptide repeat protein [Ruminococcus sp.]